MELSDVRDCSWMYSIDELKSLKADLEEDLAKINLKIRARELLGLEEQRLTDMAELERERERERFGRQCDAWVTGGHEQ